MKPVWIPELTELWLGETLIKRFNKPATNQAMVLSAFHEEEWPRWIHSPLPPLVRLRDTVNSLNKNQRTPLLFFRIAGKGTIISWELRK